MILFCAFAPLLLISKRFRTSFVPMLILSIAINIGMYTERFLIVGTSLSRKYLPDAWGLYVPSLVELSILVGSIATVLDAVPAVREDLSERVDLRSQGDAAGGSGRSYRTRDARGRRWPMATSAIRTLRRSSRRAGRGRAGSRAPDSRARRDLADPARGRGRSSRPEEIGHQALHVFRRHSRRRCRALRSRPAPPCSTCIRPAAGRSFRFRRS